MKILRTDSTNKDFIQLVKQLDELLAAMDGREHDFYNEYNKIDSIKHVIVAYNGANPVSYGAIKEFTSGTMEVKRMFTCSKFRGNGFATKVLNELETWAEELGYGYCILETGKKLPDAVRLYQKSGYERIPNYGQYVEMENSICFKKQLKR